MNTILDKKDEFNNKNFRRITGHIYEVKNQNGLNNALYDYFEVQKEDENRKKYIRKMLQNWPTKYPTKINIIDLSFECARIHLEIFD